MPRGASIYGRVGPPGHMRRNSPIAHLLHKPLSGVAPVASQRLGTITPLPGIVQHQGYSLTLRLPRCPAHHEVHHQPVAHESPPTGCQGHHRVVPEKNWVRSYRRRYFEASGDELFDECAQCLWPIATETIRRLIEIQGLHLNLPPPHRMETRSAQPPS